MKLKRGVAIVVAGAIAGVAVGLLIWAVVAGWSDLSNGEGTEPARDYTFTEYMQLRNGMRFDDVDDIMGGGGTLNEREYGGRSIVVVTYANEDGTNVRVTFIDGVMKEKAETGVAPW